MHKPLQSSIKIISIAIGLLACQTLFAEFHLPESVQIHGFLSQGYIRTTNNNFFGESQGGGTFDFRELGVNGSWRPLNDLQFSLQAVARNAGDTDDGDLRVDYGLIDYTLLSDADNLLGIRLGRVVNPFGLYNDTRDVAFTRPGILLPQSIYFDVNRQFALSGDGAHVYAERRTGFGDFLFQAGVFEPRTNDPDLKQAITFGFFSGDLEGRTSWVGRLMYELNGGQIRLALTAADLNADFKPGPVRPNLESGEFNFAPLVFSAQYNAENWSLTGEYARRPAQVNDFGPFLPDGRFTGESYYLQGTYRLRPNLEAMLRYDVLIWNRHDYDGREFEAATGIPSHRRYAKDWTIGLRWDVTPSIMLRAEFHHVYGTGWLSALENRDGFEKEWNLLSIMASYRF